MDKLAIAATSMGVLGTGATAIYGAYSMGAFDEGEAMIPKTTKEFQKKDNQGRCFDPSSKVFENWASGGKIGYSENVSDVGKNGFAKWDDSSSATESRGCVGYEGKVGTGSNKWNGSYFRLVWVLSKGKEAFSVYLTAVGKSEKLFDFSGVAYIFKKEAEVWKTDKKLEMKSDVKSISSKDVGEKFPQKGNDFLGNKNLNKYWNLLKEDGTDVLGKGGSNSNYALFKSNENGQGSGVDSGSSNLDKGGEYFFEKDKWNMPELVRNTRGVGTPQT